jgi:effector-binding domain-containing protein
MRWFLGLVLVVALVAGALYGVGRFLLPNALSVTRSNAIDRSRASVFAMVNDLRIAQEWSPYYAMDPDAEYVFSGEGPGPGQTMRWVSTVRQVGAGRMSIVNSSENQSVESILELRDRATLNSRIEMRPVDGATSVAWSVSAECAEGAINVPCRFMNLVMRGMIERDLDNGLARLKTLAEQLPDVDFEGLNPEILLVEPQSYVFDVANTSTVDRAEVERAEAFILRSVRAFMTEYALTAVGPIVRVTTEWAPTEQRMAFRVGYPFSGPRPLNFAGVEIGETPSGRALRVMHEGPREQTRLTYAKIYAYLQAHRIAVLEGGLPWEVTYSEGAGEADPTRVEIFVPLQ